MQLFFEKNSLKYLFKKYRNILLYIHFIFYAIKLFCLFDLIWDEDLSSHEYLISDNTT